MTMKQITIPLLALMSITGAKAQCDGSWRSDLDTYWSGLHAEFLDTATSPLTEADRAHFVAIPRFAPDGAYCVRAVFVRDTASVPFTMKTTKTRTPGYKAHGKLHFVLNGEERVLTVYESVPPHPGHEDELFLPFTDLTNGKETYGVGRYLDLKGPLDAIVTLDFNKAYNPYCAYNDKYSCPIPPTENHLSTEVRAGVLKYHD